MRVTLRPFGGPSRATGLPFLQADFWARFKGRFGWSSKAFLLEVPDYPGSGTPVELRVLVRRLAGPLSFAYVPWGPAVDCPPDSRSDLLASLARALRPFLPATCLFLRLDPPWFEREAPGTVKEEPPPRLPVLRPSFAAPLRKAGSDVQPPDSVLLRIDRDDEELLSAMKPKWRYNVKLAAKKGVTVESEGTAALSIFYGLYEETSRRDRIAIHPQSYYEGLAAVVAEARREGPTGEVGTSATVPELRVWVARHEGQPLASIITVFYGDTATYLYGASSDEKRSLMPAYALQWAAIRAAREAGCSTYDFYGIPPTDDPDHAMAGLYRFKTGFGGDIVHYAGSWDVPLVAPAYALWRAAEALRAFWFKDLRKRLGRRGASGAPQGAT